MKFFRNANYTDNELLVYLLSFLLTRQLLREMRIAGRRRKKKKKKKLPPGNSISAKSEFIANSLRFVPGAKQLWKITTVIDPAGRFVIMQICFPRPRHAYIFLRGRSAAFCFVPRLFPWKTKRNDRRRKKKSNEATTMNYQRSSHRRGGENYRGRFRFCIKLKLFNARRKWKVQRPWINHLGKRRKIRDSRNDLSI